MRYLVLSALLLAGCGSTSTTTDVAVAPSPAPLSSPTSPLVAGLPPAQAQLVSERSSTWSDANPDLTGTVAQANTAGLLMGPANLYQLMSPLQDNGQAVVTTYGAGFPDANRTRDCLVGVSAPQQTGGRNPAVQARLSPDLNSMPKFHALRLLPAVAIPPAQRQVFKSLRDGLALPTNGQTVAKAIKLADMQRYLNGTFDPKAFGFQVVESDIPGLNTPAQLIEGLRLDYPGGFANETRLALLLYPQTSGFSLLIPYNAAFGGTQTGDYPFSGNGFTATTQASAIPEWVLPRSGADLAPGSQLVEVTETGQRIVRGTWNGSSWGGAMQKAVTRERVERGARYRGLSVHVISREGPTAFVASTEPLPDGLQVGRADYRGQVPWQDLEW